MDGITDSMDMSLSKLWQIVKDREAWCSAIHGLTNSWTRLSDWRTTCLVGFPGGMSGKQSACNADWPGLDPWVRQVHLEERAWQHTSILAWRGAWTTIVHRVAESWTWLKRLGMHERNLGEGGSGLVVRLVLNLVLSTEGHLTNTALEVWLGSYWIIEEMCLKFSYEIFSELLRIFHFLNFVYFVYGQFLWKESYDQPRQHIVKQRQYFVKAMVFPWSCMDVRIRL